MTGNSETHGDLDAHRQSYDRFIGWLKFGTLATAVVAALVVFIITR